MTPTPPSKLRSTKLESDKSIELAGSGVTSIFPKRSDRKTKEDRRPNWVNGLLYYIRRKEKGGSMLLLSDATIHPMNPFAKLFILYNDRFITPVTAV